MKKISISDFKFEKRVLAQLSESELRSLKGGAGTEETADSLCECVTDICLTDTEVGSTDACVSVDNCTPAETAIDCEVTPPAFSNACTVSKETFACLSTIINTCSC